MLMGQLGEWELPAPHCGVNMGPTHTHSALWAPEAFRKAESSVLGAGWIAVCLPPHAQWFLSNGCSLLQSQHPNILLALCVYLSSQHFHSCSSTEQHHLRCVLCVQMGSSSSSREVPRADPAG